MLWPCPLTKHAGFSSSSEKVTSRHRQTAAPSSASNVRGRHAAGASDTDAAFCWIPGAYQALRQTTLRTIAERTGATIAEMKASLSVFMTQPKPVSRRDKMRPKAGSRSELTSDGDSVASSGSGISHRRLRGGSSSLPASLHVPGGGCPNMRPYSRVN